jgi:hypothetical protein
MMAPCGFLNRLSLDSRSLSYTSHSQEELQNWKQTLAPTAWLYSDFIKAQLPSTGYSKEHLFTEVRRKLDRNWWKHLLVRWKLGLYAGSLSEEDGEYMAAIRQNLGH